MRTPLGKVRGLGSAKEGTEHFWRQRVTALANVPLLLFFIVLVVGLVGKDYGVAVAALSSPFVAILMAFVILCVCVHMKLGMQVIIEDYIHGALLKVVLIIGNIFFCYGVGALSLFALLKIVFGS